MAEAVTGSAEVYNFGIDGNDDYRAFTAIKTVDDLKNIKKDVTGNYVIMADELDAGGMEMLCDHGNKFAGKLAGNGCKLTLSKPLFEYNSGLVMGINAAGTIDVLPNTVMAQLLGKTAEEQFTAVVFPAL